MARPVKEPYADAEVFTSADALPSFPVVVETTIGNVTVGNGTQNPFVAAMQIVAEYHSQSGASEAVYRFAGPGDNETISVGIGSTTRS